MKKKADLAYQEDLKCHIQESELEEPGTGLEQESHTRCSSMRILGPPCEGRGKQGKATGEGVRRTDEEGNL